MAKKLIINADDFGVAEGINEGIVECYTRGTVTDISLLAVGESFEHAVELANKNNIRKTGVHLALTGSFKPVSPAGGVSTLLDKDARFPKNYGSFLTKYFTGLIKRDEIYTELKNQIAKIRKTRFAITHVDSHQHIHMVPGILKLVIKLAKEEGIRYIRFPMEILNILVKLVDPHLWARNLMLSSMCRLSKRLLVDSGIEHNDYFIGHVQAHKMKTKHLTHALSCLKEGTTELGCHPGRFTEYIEKKYPQYRSCEEELNVLCNTGFIDDIKKHSIELVSY